MNNNSTEILKIVTVEDSPIVAERLRVMLNDLQGIDFSGNATNINDAINLITEQNPGVVILDIHLKENAPHRSGINLLTILRKHYPNMVIIIFSNLSFQQYRDRCALLGANYFFDKSTDFELVTETLKEIVLQKSYYQ